MDILKILSRSTKRTGKSRGAVDDKVKLPSAGTNANPQLFHDEVPGSRGKKRKRGEDNPAMNLPDEVEAEEELNYFAPKVTNLKSKKSVPSKDAAEQSSPKQAPPPKLLDEEECRQTLRSHRLKITVLSSVKPKARAKRSEKTKKLQSKKADHKQLYPQPLMALEDLGSLYGISRRMGQNLARQGYKVPTEVQMASLPLLLKPKMALGSAANDIGVLDGDDGFHLLTVAPTGSGKTLAFLIPLLNKILQRRRISEDKEHSLEAIVIAPTKELASQIVNEAKKLSMGTGVKVTGMRKGMKLVEGQDVVDHTQDSSEEESPDEDHEFLERTMSNTTTQPVTKADILITTPGLLLSALSTGPSDPHLPLPTVRTLVLDEADVLLDPLFRDQTLGIWASCTNASLNVTLWSATMGSNIETLAKDNISSSSANPKSLIRLVVGLKDSALPTISHKLVYAANEPGKLIALRQLLHPSGEKTQALRPPFLVFTQTIPRAIALHSELLYDIPAVAGGSSRIAVLHSDLSDSARDKVMTRFRNGEIWVMITTDILSRGVDFRGINGVVNYDVPNSGAVYVHRVGRTGRAGRQGGVAVTFYTKEDIPYVRQVATIIAASEKQAGVPPSEAGMQKWLLDALPKPTKDQKKNLKLHGVEARRGGLKEKSMHEKGKGKKGRVQISTKSGYERRLEDRKKGAIEGSRRRKVLATDDGAKQLQEDDGNKEWRGFDK